jgi:hypothetical protein
MALFTRKTAKAASKKATLAKKAPPQEKILIVSREGQILKGAKIMRVR